MQRGGSYGGGHAARRRRDAARRRRRWLWRDEPPALLRPGPPAVHRFGERQSQSLRFQRKLGRSKHQFEQPECRSRGGGAGYSNRNQPEKPQRRRRGGGGRLLESQPARDHNAGAAAAGAGYANHNNQSPYSNAGAAAAGAAYGNRNGYDQYHPGMAAGYWNGNYGASNLGAYGGMGMASPAYGYGSTPYMNPYAGAGLAGVGAGQAGGQAQPANAAPVDYSQPLNTAAAPPDVASPADPSTSPMGQARQAFQAGDYDTALRLTQQALGQLPNDVSLNEFLALILFAQGNYEQAAAPLYAVLSVGPGWDWTTLAGNYSDTGIYTGQLRGLEAFLKANPRSAKGLFVLAYHYISDGHPDAAVGPLKRVVAIQPDDKLSAHLLDKLRPSARRRPRRSRSTPTSCRASGPRKLPQRDDHPHDEREREFHLGLRRGPASRR